MTFPLYKAGEPTSEAEIVFNDAHRAFLTAETRVLAFRLTAIAGFRSGDARPLLANYNRSTYLSSFGKALPAAPELSEALRLLTSESVINEIVAAQQDDALVSIDASCLLLAHIFFDRYVSQLCLAVALHKPEAMAERLAERKVALRGLRDVSYAALLRTLIKEHADALDRDSLVKRIQFLFALCAPPSAFQPIEGFTFDLDRLADIDRRRQEIVHRANFTKPSQAVDEQIDILWKSAAYLTEVVVQSGLQISLVHVVEQARKAARV